MFIKGNFDDRSVILLQRIPSDIMAVLLETKGFVAGGSIATLFRDQHALPRDYDVYWETIKDYKTAVNMVKSRMQDITVVRDLKSIFGFSYKGVCFDFVGLKSRIGSSEKIMPKFHMINCMGAYIPSTGDFVLHKDFLVATLSKTIMINPDYDLSSDLGFNSSIILWHVFRYIMHYGYKISFEESNKLQKLLQSNKHDKNKLDREETYNNLVTSGTDLDADDDDDGDSNGDCNSDDYE